MSDDLASLAAYLERAVELARRGEGHTRPNPPVGAVLVREGRVIGEGWHRRAGGDHAEVAAIRNAVRRGASPAGALAVVTLEPCSRPGRVGACTDALIAAGVAEVFYAVADPNPTNRGRAKRVLARAGIRCRCLADASFRRGSEPAARARLAAAVGAARELIAPFAKHVTTGRPFVTVKLAMSLDGRICDERGDAKWISSARSRAATGRLRERVDAIMVGAETVRRDDPSLLSHGRRNDDLVRVVVSRTGRLPRKAQVFADGLNETLVFDDAQKALDELGRAGFLHVLCEGGLSLARSLADAGCVDRWLAVTCPVVIGSRPINRALRLRLADAGILDPASGDRIGCYARSDS